MEAYPPQYVEHNLPFVLLSGLGEEDNTDQSHESLKRQGYGARISIESPECKTEQAGRLLQEFRAWDGTNHAWNSTASPGPSGTIRYKMKTIGRAYTLPARKAAPMPQSPGGEGSPALRSTELHSPLSPLSPGSPVFPDGIYTPLWFSKHQQQVPALFLALFSMNANEASQDEQLRNDINSVRGALARSGFKTRFAAVLISDKSILHAPDLEDRLGSIRRATTLDPKTGLFFMPPMSSQAEIATFVQSMMAALQPSCVEFYRDLTKHARRKKARGGPPPLASTPVGGASQSTSTSGWNVRYEVKQGVFAEFRQEMDVAERHYSAAIEELFSSEGGVFETTASWSLRWAEARLLCDAIALRTLRCQLWNGYTTGAVQSWQNYKQRMTDLIDRRGKGSNSYGWNAWEARWASVMSQLIQLADIPPLRKSFKSEDSEVSVQQVFALPEKSVQLGDRLPPWNFLHHSGYWLRLVANGIRARWKKAKLIPEEDRVPPGQSPASAVANRWKTYDVYLVPEPHEEFPVSGDSAYDHTAELGTISIRAAEEFDARQQRRMSEQVRFELAVDLVRAGKISDALQVLTQLWESSTWRDDEWILSFSQLLRLLSECANRNKSAQNAALIPALTWEMLSVAPVDLPDNSIDLASCLDAWDTAEPLLLSLHDDNRLCPISAAFAFQDRESSVGEAQLCQLRLAYETSKASKPLDVSRVELNLGPKTIVIRHQSSRDTKLLSNLPPAREPEGDVLETRADLTLKPSAKKILNFSLMLREAQLWSVGELTIHVETSKFTLGHTIAEDAVLASTRWYVEKDGELSSLILPHMATKSVNVLPKLPKMQIRLHSSQRQYLTDEKVHLEVELINEEAEAVNGTMASKAIGTASEVLIVKWTDNEAEEDITRTISGLAPLGTERVGLDIYAPPEASTFTLTLDLRYTLDSDPATPLTKTLTLELPFVAAFETKFTFQSRLHSNPWPSYFDPASKSTEDSPDGVTQLWKVSAQVASITDQNITLHKLELSVHEVQGDALCSIQMPVIMKERALQAGAKLMFPFELTTQKHALDDRRPSYLDLSLVLDWSHENGAGKASTTIALPRLTIPTSEPRVLCTAKQDPSSESGGTITLQYHLENPSTHFLTFGITMEASEDFAFSGPKYRTLSLAPLSRHHVDYQIQLHKEFEVDESEAAEGYWIAPNLQVVDSYYQKNLKVLPGSDRVKLDEKRDINVWVGKSEPV